MKIILSVIGKILTFIYMAIASMGSLFFIFIELRLGYDLGNFWGVLIGVAFMPICIIAAPFYIFFAYHNAYPIILAVILGASCAFLGCLSMWLMKE